MIPKRSIALTVLAALIFAGCASMSVTMTVERAPTINTIGIKKIAVMDFTPSDNSALQKEVASALTSSTLSRIQATRHFDLVSADEIRRLQASNQSIDTQVDALFTGKIDTLNVREYTEMVDRYNPDTGGTYQVPVYNREVQLAFTYMFTRSRDGSIIGTATKRGQARSRNENANSLETASQISLRVINDRLKDLHKDVAPYTATEKRTLKDEKSKNKDLQNRMKSIFEYVKQKNYKVALEGYLDTYKTYGNFAAAYNAAILYEAMGELQEAVSLLSNVFQNTGNPEASAEINRLNAAIAEAGLLSTEYADQRNQRQKVLDFAIGEIRRSIPAAAKVWVVNKSETGERDIAVQIADGITAALVNNRITVVDRENASLMEAEQKFQMSGNVSDDDFMSIGNAAGANTMITIEITGVSGNRRLSLVILDIETRTRRYVSDTSENWHL